MENTKLLEAIVKRLGVLIALHMHDRSENFTGAQSIELLSRFDLSPTEIAEILDTSTNTVNVTRSRLKKRKK